MKKKARNLGPAYGVAALVLFGACAGGTAWWMAQPVSEVRERTVRVTIAPRASAAAVGRLLQSRGIIRSAFLWERYVARGARIQPGVYDLNPSESPERILKKLVRGEVVAARVTFPEGYTVAKMAARLVDKGFLKSPDAFVQLATTGGRRFRASVPLPDNLEGYLFPDTYSLPSGATEAQILQTMVDNFDRRVVAGQAGAPRPLHETLTIASMVEREAETDGDRPRIAGVIENRLRAGMRLEIDATVQYARGKHVSRLLYRDLKVDSPYNTYRHAGLPPGPICCPGLPSIEAARRPTRSPYFFYVAGRDGKTHVFSRTFAEHKANIARIRRP